VLLMGDAAASQMPVILLAVVAATIVHGKVATGSEPEAS
jgi:hypothetical protein